MEPVSHGEAAEYSAIPPRFIPETGFRELPSVGRKLPTQENYFSTGVMFPEISFSFSLGTG